MLAVNSKYSSCTISDSAGISVSKELSGYEAGKKDRVGDIVLHSLNQGREKLIDVTC